MSRQPIPFPVTDLGDGQYQFLLEDFWDTCRAWAQHAGFPKEHGHYQGTPPM